MNSSPDRHVPFNHEDWRMQARCVDEDTNRFYYPDGAHKAAKAQIARVAKNICYTCPVVDECKEWAFDTEQEHGIWGATTEEERNIVFKRRHSIKYLNIDNRRR